MITSTVTPEIVEFAQGVRAALADLPAEEVDDLTDGLEADLAESLAEDLRRTLPDPAAYAAELRAAAGLPMRSGKRSDLRVVIGEITQSGRRAAIELSDALQRNPLTSGLLDFLAAVRPLWWLVRAWIAFTVLRLLVGGPGPAKPHDIPDLLVLGALVIVSVQWGRKRWFPRRLLMPVIVVGNSVAVLLLVPALGQAHASFYENSFAYFSPTESQAAPPGLAVNGREVANVFAYDRDGKLLRGVQLFDEHGAPLVTRAPERQGNCTDDTCGHEWMWAPRTSVNGKTVWNVFPLNRVNAVMDDEGTTHVPGDGDPLERQPPPYAKVPALVSPETVAKSND